MRKVNENEVKVRVEHRKIKIPDEILTTHDECRQRGDYSAISVIAYGSADYRAKVMNAILRKEAEKNLWDAIIQFYTEVKKQTEQILSEYDNYD